MSTTPIDMAAVSAALLAVGEVSAQVLEAVNGYRAQCQAAGYPEAVVDHMVTDYHAGLMRLLFQATPSA